MAYLLDYDVSASIPGHLSPRAQKTTRKSWFLNMWKERNARHQRPKCLKSVLPPAKAFTFAVRTAQFICGWVGTYALIEYFLAPHYVLLGSQEKRTKGIQTIKIRSMAPIVPRLVRKVLVLSNHVSSLADNPAVVRLAPRATVQARLLQLKLCETASQLLTVACGIPSAIDGSSFAWTV